MISTPALNDFAVRSRSLVNAASLATVILSAPTLPEKIERLSLPTFTCRFRASLSSDSSFGRKLLTSTSNGRINRMRIRIPTAIAPMALHDSYVLPSLRFVCQPELNAQLLLLGVVEVVVLGVLRAL